MCKKHGAKRGARGFRDGRTDGENHAYGKPEEGDVSASLRRQPACGNIIFQAPAAFPFNCPFPLSTQYFPSINKGNERERNAE